MPDLIRKSCAEFASALASDAPTPGGGGAAALCSVLAASLGAMAARLSAPRKKTEAERESLQERVEIADALRQRLLSLIDWDAACFEPLSKAYAIPREDPERKEKLRAASLTACAAPMEMLRCCGETAELLEELSGLVSPLLLSDVGCAAALCHGALEAAAMNVWVNTKGLPGDAEAESLNAETRAILDKALPLTAEITARVREKLET